MQKKLKGRPLVLYNFLLEEGKKKKAGPLILNGLKILRFQKEHRAQFPHRDLVWATLRYLAKKGLLKTVRVIAAPYGGSQGIQVEFPEPSQNKNT